MFACRILNILVTPVAIVTIPFQIVTTAVGGCLVSCSLGLLLLPLSAVWAVLLGLLLGTSWLWDLAERLRVGAIVALAHIPLAVIGIPLALVSAVYVALIPSMGEIESRHTKMYLCWVWPFSLDYWHFSIRTKPIDTPRLQQRYDRLLRALRVAGVHIP